MCSDIRVRFFFFKRKTAYEMLRSLVGSEMCIRDRLYNKGKCGSPCTNGRQHKCSTCGQSHPASDCGTQRKTPHKGGGKSGGKGKRS